MPTQALVYLHTHQLLSSLFASSRFTAAELSLLLEEMGFDSLDLRGFRVHAVSGARLLEMSEDDMAIDLVLPRSKVRASRWF
jgi:hypothetical protein